MEDAVRKPPLSMRASPEALAKYAEPFQGYPEHLRPAIEQWMSVYGGFGSLPATFVNRTLANFVLWRRKASPAGFNAYSTKPVGETFATMRSDADFALDLIDFLAGIAPEGGRKELEACLRLGGSAYMVDPTGTSGLVHRVPQEAIAALKTALDGTGKASQHLALAWRELYGRDPNPSSAYREAVRAVEVYACPAILPTNPKATLGTVLSAMRDAPGKLITVFKEQTGSGTAVAMMNLLWRAQHDRHGDADESVPLHVSEEEARAAVHLAILIVTWWHQGTLRSTVE